MVSLRTSGVFLRILDSEKFEGLGFKTCPPQVRILTKLLPKNLKSATFVCDIRREKVKIPFKCNQLNCTFHVAPNVYRLFYLSRGFNVILLRLFQKRPLQTHADF